MSSTPEQVLSHGEQKQKMMERDEQQQKIKEEVPSPLRKRATRHDRVVVEDSPRPCKLPRLDLSFPETVCEVNDLLLLELTSPVDVADEATHATGEARPAFSLSAGIPNAATRPFSHDETVIILDWDNTLLPSTWLFTEQMPQFNIGDKVFWIHSNDPLPEGALGTVLGFKETLQPESVQVKFPKGSWLFNPLDLLHAKDLLDVANSAIEILHIAQRHGTPVVVTNSEQGWIERTCQKFLPALYAELQQVKLMSARTTYESATMESPVDWKVCAFKSEVERLFGNDRLYDPTSRKNIVSIGDGPEERAALQNVTASLPNCRSKSLKMIVMPEISQIQKQHSLIKMCLDRIANHDGDLDLAVTSKAWYDVI